MAKLTTADVIAIRAEYAAGGVRQVDLAERFGVTQSTVSAVLRRKTWTTV